MKIKQAGAFALIFMMLFSVAPKVNALEHGAYGVYAGTNYWNPDTGEIDDGGTANAALGDGMSRSVTSTKALVEKDGDKYYVTLRLLLQSNCNSISLFQRTGNNTYSKVSYQIMAENAVEDSVDYRFQVNDPFAPIKASMYVVPMGRETTWFIQLDKSSTSSDTGNFIVSVKEAEPEVSEPEITEPEDEVLENETQEPEVIEPEISKEEPEVSKSEEVLEETAKEEVLETLEDDTQDDVQEEVDAEEDLLEDLDETMLDDEESLEQDYEDEEDFEQEDLEILEQTQETEETQETEVHDTTQTEEKSSNSIIYAGLIGVVVGVASYFIIKRKKA